MVLRSGMLTRAGFEHGFGTRGSTPVDLPRSIHLLQQVHGERIVVLTGGRIRRRQGYGEQGAQGEGRKENPNLVMKNLPEKPFRFDKGDAMVTSLPGVSIGIRTADCLPILLGDPATGTAAAIHCGWRSLALGLAAKGVRALLNLTGSDPDGLVAAMGPSIGPCCYEVGKEVRNAFSPGQFEWLFESRGDNLYLDLAAGAKSQMLSEGMAPETIEEIAGCTSCNDDRFWSWRARKDEERMISFITAREPSSIGV